MKISFLGDSITYGYALENRADRYTTHVCAALGAEEANFGITGTLVAKAGLNNGDDKAFVDRLHLVMDGDVTVIFGGTNDYFWSDKIIGDEENVGDLTTFYGAVDFMLKKIKEERGDKPTLFVTPYSHNGIGNFFGGEHWQTDSSRHDTTEKNFCGYTLSDYSDTIVKLCNKYGVPVLDLHHTEGFDWRKHTSDGCHPNPEGHKWLAEKIAKKLRDIL